MRDADPDAQLMLAFCAGDGSAFDSLFDRWGRPLLHYLERMVVDSGTAEELVQEVFLRVYRA
ncbi:MAG: RNA polymerase sigma factor, partial [Myxococcota bacterium]|nr:RNA polymerase sigma factor [Myxococcota bacterium]